MDIIRDQGNLRLAKFRPNLNQIIFRNKCVPIEDPFLAPSVSIRVDHHNLNIPKSLHHNDTTLALVLHRALR
jgi:hypothetical protein